MGSESKIKKCREGDYFNIFFNTDEFFKICDCLLKNKTILK